jgi:hypothetical protein
LARELWFFVERGHAYEVNGQRDRALSDYADAILLDPNLINTTFKDLDRRNFGVAVHTNGAKV